MCKMVLFATQEMENANVLLLLDMIPHKNIKFWSI